MPGSPSRCGVICSDTLLFRDPWCAQARRWMGYPAKVPSTFMWCDSAGSSNEEDELRWHFAPVQAGNVQCESRLRGAGPSESDGTSKLARKNRSHHAVQMKDSQNVSARVTASVMAEIDLLYWHPGTFPVRMAWAGSHSATNNAAGCSMLMHAPRPVGQ